MSDPLPDLQQTGQTPGTPGTGVVTGHSIASAKPSGFRKFIEHNIESGKSLTERLAALAGPQESVSADAPASAEPSSFSALVKEIVEKKGEVSLWAILFARLKVFFTRDHEVAVKNYDAEITKKAFSKIDQDQKKVFLQAALEFIALPENEGNKAEYMQILLELYHGDPEGEKSFVNSMINKDPRRLAGLLMDNEPPKLNLSKNQSKQLADALLKAGDDGAIQLAKLIDGEKLTGFNLSKNQSNQLADALLKAGDDGTIQLAKLIDGEKLPGFNLSGCQFSQFAMALIETGPAGMAFLKELLMGKDDKLQITGRSKPTCNYLAIVLANAGKEGMAFLKGGRRIVKRVS
jgi:hypothetical protein